MRRIIRVTKGTVGTDVLGSLQPEHRLQEAVISTLLNRLRD
jgi:hypothetical protein